MTVSPSLVKKLAKIVLDANRKGLTYRQMSEICGVKAGTISTFAKSKGKYIPKDKHILQALGLLHRRQKKISEMSIPELLWRLENREQI